jgi:hypothetical protein
MVMMFFTFLCKALFAQFGETKDNITISTNYYLSSLNDSKKDLRSESILTWRDVYLNGVYVNIGFPKAPFSFDKTNIGVGFSSSFHGYHTDDDANNKENVIWTTDTEVTMLELNYEWSFFKEGLSPKLGFDFNMIKYKNIDGRGFIHVPNSGVYYINGPTTIAGKVNTYDIYKLDFYYGIKSFNAFNRVIYMDISGQVGIGMSLALANWIHRPDFKHPISFYDFGFNFIGGSNLEMGFRIGRVTLFYKALLIYEINPWQGITNFFMSDGSSAGSFYYSDFLRTSFGTGLKVSF